VLSAFGAGVNEVEASGIVYIAMMSSCPGTRAQYPDSRVAISGLGHWRKTVGNASSLRSRTRISALVGIRPSSRMKAIRTGRISSSE